MKHIKVLSKAQVYYVTDSAVDILSVIFNFILDLVSIVRSPRHEDRGKENF